MPEASICRGIAGRIPIPVSLSWLQKLDTTDLSGSLPDAFGDSYLCAHNPLYRAIRRGAMNLGYEFSSADSRLWRDYSFLPLSTIDRILIEKSIPYADNWLPLRSIMATEPGARMSIGSLTSSLKKNYVFHESAHALADHALSSLTVELSSVCEGGSQAEVISSILGESFANAIEMTGGDFALDPLADEIFYTMNSYMTPSVTDLAILRKAAETWGESRRFLIFAVAYFKSNLTRGDAAVSNIAAQMECLVDRRDFELMTSVVQMACRLNRGFREKTVPYYFERKGLSGVYGAVAGAGWLKSNEQYQFVKLFAEKAMALTLSPGQVPSRSVSTSPGTTH